MRLSIADVAKLLPLIVTAVPADPTVGVKLVIVGALATPSLITVNGVLLVVEPLGVVLKPMPATVTVVPTGPLFGVN
jgi:hypothetical protein